MKIKKDKATKKDNIEKVEKKSKPIKKDKNPVVAVITEEKPVKTDAPAAKTKTPLVVMEKNDEDKSADTLKKKLSIKERKLAKKQKIKEKKEQAKAKGLTPGGTLPLTGDKTKKQKKKHKKAFIENRPGENVPVDVNFEVDPTILAEIPDELVTRDVMEKAISACKKAVGLEQEKKKSLFTDDLKMSLYIAYMKIPKCPSRSARIELKNPLYKKGDEICLIVSDLTKGMKLDHEPTTNHWNELLNKLDIDFITKVISFNQLKKDYKPFEMKAKLAKQFDRFLVDGRVSGNVFHFLGSQFSKRNKHPVSVKLNVEENIKLNLRKALTKVQYKQVNSGPSVEIPFGISKMDESDLVENALDLVGKLKEIFPGGWLNIKKLMIKPMMPCKIIFPVYVSKIDPNAIPIPVITGPRETFEKKQNAKLDSASKKKLKIKKGKLTRTKPEAADAAKPESDEAKEKSEDGSKVESEEAEVNESKQEIDSD